MRDAREGIGYCPSMTLWVSSRVLCRHKNEHVRKHASVAGDPRVPSVKARLMWSVPAVALLLLVLATVGLFRTYALDRDRAAGLLLDQARALALQVDAEFQRTEVLLRAMTASSALRGGDLAAWRDEVRQALDHEPHVGVELFDDSGTLLARWPAGASAGTSAGDAPAASQLGALAPGRIVSTNLIAAPVPGHGAIHFHGRIATPQAAIVRLRVANAALADIVARHRFEGGRVAAILDRNDVVVARARRPEALVGRHATPAVRQALATGTEGFLFGLVNQDGVSSVVAYARAPASGYAAVIAMPEAEFYRPLMWRLTELLGIGAVIVTLGLLVTWRFLRRVVRAIDRLESVSDQALPTGLRETDAIAQRLAAAARERAAAERIRDRFLGMVSHELRAPLSAMIGWASVLQKMRPDAGTLARGLSAIERNGRAQARLIDDLLDLTRLDEGKLALARAPLQLDAVIRAAMETVQADAIAKDVALDIDIAATPMVDGDAARLQQVFWNLLGNALKFTPAGGRIGIRLDSGGTRARCAVTDSGAGIDPAFLPFVFEPFRQGSADAGVGSQGGLGLGLAIARRIVEAHGGSIVAHSDGAGTGATFTVELPVASTAAALQPATASG